MRLKQLLHDFSVFIENIMVEFAISTSWPNGHLVDIANSRKIFFNVHIEIIQ